MATEDLRPADDEEPLLCDIKELSHPVLQRALGLSGLPYPEVTRRRNEFARLAVAEWVDWLTSKRRVDSIPALERDRLVRIFALIRNESPTVQALAEQFAIPEGRAIAMRARMRYGAARWIRGKELERLAKTLDEDLKKKEEDAGTQGVKDDDPVTMSYPATLSKQIHAELVRLYEGGCREIAPYNLPVTPYGVGWPLTKREWGHLIKKVRDQSVEELGMADAAGLAE